MRLLSKIMTYKWHRSFQSGASMDGERLDQPSRAGNNYLIVQEKDIHANHWLTILEVAEETGKSILSCHTILTEILGCIVSWQSLCQGF
jgi:hypothetical protein